MRSNTTNLGAGFGTAMLCFSLLSISIRYLPPGPYPVVSNSPVVHVPTYFVNNNQ